MRNANMLLKERVNKSGDNSAEEELIECAYVRTGKKCCLLQKLNSVIRWFALYFIFRKGWKTDLKT